MIIAVDAMGGDHAPHVTVKGVVDALRQGPKDLSVILVGNRPAIEKELTQCRASSLSIEIVHTDEVVEMHDAPSKAFKTKPNSSMNLTIKLQAEGKAQASLSAGNTGALLVSSVFTLGRLEGVQRPALPIVVPAMKSPLVVVDVGANSDCKPQHLLQFALMGAAYAKHILDLKEPKVGLLSIGTESSKGNELTLSTYPLLEKTELTFVGNVEANTILAGGTEVIVCDGFVGNIVLKLLESIVALFAKSDERRASFDYSKYGGAQFLGVNGICVKAHGQSNAEAIKNAVVMAEKAIRQNINKIITDYIGKHLNGN